MLTGYPINGRVSLRVTGRIPSGLIGWVDCDVHALVRNREISWEETDDFDRYVGGNWQAIVLRHSRRGLELSIRCAQRDPWEQAESKYRPGSRVDGQVVGLIERGAFLELEPGVEGFLPIDELPIRSEDHIGDGLWIQDRMKASVASIDFSSRRLQLGLRHLLLERQRRFQRQLWAGGKVASGTASVEELIPHDVRLMLLQIGRKLDPQAQSNLPVSVLIIEDDPLFARALQSFLELNNCRVKVARDGPSGLALGFNPELSFDLILIDWNLPGLSGRELIGRLKENSIGHRCLVLMINLISWEQDQHILRQFRQSEFEILVKGEIEDFQDRLLAIVRDLGIDGKHERLSMSPNVSLSPFAERMPPIKIAAQDAPSSRRTDGLDGILMQLQQGTRASSVALVQMDYAQRLHLVACSGLPFPIDKAPPDIIYSPLMDVLGHNQVICETVKRTPLRFERLLSLLPFEGFLGIPLCGLADGHYGLILVTPEASFGAAEIAKAELAAYLATIEMREQQLTHALKPWQALNLLGQLNSSVLHEVNNALGGIHLSVTVLDRGVEDLRLSPQKAEDPDFMRRLKQAIESIGRARQQASRLKEQYLVPRDADREVLVDLEKVADEVCQLLRSEAQKHNILLDVMATDGPFRLRGQRRQLRQVLLNLVLNALQQMVVTKCQGNLTIQLSHVPDEALPIHLRVIDDGPGIHRLLWERIFDFGFTTKDDGAGLGLTISNRIVAELEGRLTVEESQMFWGSTFLLELPMGEKDA